jgi:hypothetical protein
MEVSQNEVFEASAYKLIDSVAEGYNGTIFAYGQTGCGKTHTMMGQAKPDQQGIVPRSFRQIVDLTDHSETKKFLVQVSYIEIYNEEVHDLLGKDIKEHMEVKENPGEGFYVKGLTKITVNSVASMEAQMKLGFERRATGETLMNK